MTDVQIFQKAHGEAYSKLVNSRAFNEGMFLLNSEKLKAITILGDDDIEKNSRVILADLRGWLQHELLLSTLHDRKTFDPAELPAETYEGEDEPPAASSSKRKKKTP